MAFDSSTRGKLQRIVAGCRRLLTEEFDDQLQSLYGIYAVEGRVLDLDRLTNLDDDQRGIGALLRERIQHLESGLTSSKTPLKDAVQRVLREQAFTILNRFAALRMAEERELVLQCVGDGFNSKGFQVFENVSSPDLGSQYERYRVFLDCLFDELSLDLGVLFDRFSPFGLLFPREPKLKEFFSLLNDPELKSLWREDETIGWIFQYFNDEAERKKMREESSAPRNSRELAVRNQFFTPRYVVEFLTDNTLGRLWYEMTRGETILRDRCRYLVRRPMEVFLKPGESVHEKVHGGGAEAGENLSQEDLLRQPVHISHRPLKDPREIRLLDPACGSMHFGLYAFDLFTVIYDEAWEIAYGADEAAKSTETFAPFVVFAATFPDKAAFLHEVPRLIVDRNIHGIDIDPRAVQIAGLSLWLRAQRAWHEAGVKPADRPRIVRSNVVCAEPMPGEKELLREFVEQQFPSGERPAFAFLLEKIFDRMTLAGEAGSLLRIEEEIRTAIANAKRLWKEGPKTEQASLFAEPGEESDQGEMRLDLSGITDEQFWERAELRIYDALEAYAEQAENGGGFQRRLFADDAAQGFAFIDLCRKRYDVVVMNPPFGLPSQLGKAWINSAYPDTWKDMYAASGERAFQLLNNTGVLGAITPSMWLYTREMREFRAAMIERGSPNWRAELGLGVMDDAVVEAAIWISRKGLSQTAMLSLDLLEKPPSNRAELLLTPAVEWRQCWPSDFMRIEGSPYCHHLDRKLLAMWTGRDRLEPALVKIAAGNTTFDDFRFLRAGWETPAWENDGWKVYRSGGDFQPYLAASGLHIDWRKSGASVRESGRSKHGSEAQVMQSSIYWGKPGLAYPRIGTLGVGVRVAPRSEIFSSGSVFLNVEEQSIALTLLGILNSPLATALLEAHGRHRRTETIAFKDLPLSRAFVSAAGNTVGNLALRAVQEVYRWECQDETNPFFAGCIMSDWKSWVTQCEGISDDVLRITEEISVRLGEILDVRDIKLPSPDAGKWKTNANVREGVARTLSWGVGAAFGRWDIRYATGERSAPELANPFAPLPVRPPGMLQGDDSLPLSAEAGRRLRAEGHYPLDVAWDGILVDDPEHPLDIERRVHAALTVIWGDRADALEHEACALLAVATLRDWFRRPTGFFADHLKRYSKSRRQAPIYWPLSTASGSYTLWLYYHRLNDQTLYSCVTDFVKPKLDAVTADADRLQSKTQTGGTAKERAELQDLLDFQAELQELHDELLRVAQLPWKPNLNDGVLIAASPLWKLFRLPKWQKDLKAIWERLSAGDYGWAHLALTIWPGRVREKCKTDRSLAIAHGLEDLCEVKSPKPKATNAKKVEESTPERSKGSNPRAMLQPARASQTIRREDFAPPPIDETDRTEVLCIIRQVFSKGGERDRETAIAEVAIALGYQRVGSHTRDVLNTDFLTAVRRGILVNENGMLSLGANDLRDQTRESMKSDFLGAIGRTWTEREDAIRLFARWLGYARTGSVIEEIARSLMNGLIREGRLERDGNRIRRS